MTEGGLIIDCKNLTGEILNRQEELFNQIITRRVFKKKKEGKENFTPNEKENF